AELAATPPVLTAVVGVGPADGDLDRVAAAGGTGAATFVDPSKPDAIAAALERQRRVSLPCRFPVDPGWLASGRANLELAAPDGVIRLRQVPAEGACASAPAVPEWFAVDGQTAAVCPSSCPELRAVAYASLDVVYGCPTVVSR
ncbi:MAG: hypothetical protein FJ104_06280, partial [Deltaproteobacteria bacterium]|nr:hypothetical protein [Deltaproteobacteria bacterium]